MSRIPSVLIGAIVLLVLFFSMISYSVQYSETAIITTFGRAGDGSVKNAAGDDAGLKFKWPWPIQDVARRYDTRVLVMEDRLEELQTKDRQSIVMSAYIAYRITDPLAFYRTLNTVNAAEQQLGDRLRATKARIGEYTFDDITNLDPAKLKLAELEGKMQTDMQAELDRRGYGVKIETVGVKRLIFAESVTAKVFERMRANRLALAQEARSAGEAESQTIRSNAKSVADRIMAFALLRADVIRSDGEKDAAALLKTFQQAPELSVFLRSTESLRRIFERNTVFFIDHTWGAPFDLPQRMQQGQQPLPRPAASAAKKDE
jgi:modulator of FtsH protease HflC